MTDGTYSFATTYAQLKARVGGILSSKGVSHQRVMNYSSALHGWMRRLELTDDNLVGKEMGEEFDQEYLRHQDYLLTTLAPRTARDQSEHLLTWRRYFEECRHIDTLPHDFKGALNSLFATSGLTKAELSRQSGVTTGTLYRWMDLPDLPVAASAPELFRLEQALRVPQGTLLNRLPGRRYTRYARTVKESGSLQTPWGKKQSENRKSLGEYHVPLVGPLREQLLDLTDFKTDLFREGAAASNSWRAKPAKETGCRISTAMMTRSGLICPTAAANWTGFSSYLGFLCLPRPGKGLPADEVNTLAWLVHVAFIQDYVRWLISRANNKLHHGIPKFLDDTKCMLRPKTGFLWSRPDLASSLPNPSLVLGHDFALLDSEMKDERWRTHCALAHQKFAAIAKNLRKGGSGAIGKSRDPRAPIANILSSPSPLKVILRFVYDLESNPPPLLHHRDYIVWLRDVVMTKMISSNPLRASQFGMMRYRDDNLGNLYQAIDGHWRIRFFAADFKNEKGAAFEDYDVAIEPSVGPWIARYLAESRPHLLGASECDYFFLPGVPGPNHGQRKFGEEVPDKGGMWNGDSISKRLVVLTKQYICGTPGFRAQAFRHIIATDHLMRHPGDYLSVAKLLHDTLATVLKEYGHLSTEHSLKGLHFDIANFNAELRKGSST